MPAAQFCAAGIFYWQAGQADAHSGPCKGNGKSADDIFTLP